MPKPTVKIEMPVDEAMYFTACLHGVIEYLDEKCKRDDHFNHSTAQLIAAKDRIQDAIIKQSHPDDIQKITKG